MKNGESPVDDIVRGLNIPIITSHTGLNPRLKSDNESSFAGELSIKTNNSISAYRKCYFILRQFCYYSRGQG